MPLYPVCMLFGDHNNRADTANHLNTEVHEYTVTVTAHTQTQWHEQFCVLHISIILASFKYMVWSRRWWGGTVDLQYNINWRTCITGVVDDELRVPTYYIACIRRHTPLSIFIAGGWIQSRHGEDHRTLVPSFFYSRVSGLHTSSTAHSWVATAVLPLSLWNDLLNVDHCRPVSRRCCWMRCNYR